MKRYTAYKDGGVEWIGEIPEHWEIKRVKSIAQVYNGATPKSIEGYWNGAIAWVTPSDISQLGEQKFIKETIRTITETGLQSCGCTLCPPNSLIVTNRAPIGNIAISKIAITTNQGCKSIVMEDADVHFIYYVFKVSTEELNARGQGTTFTELSTFSLRNFKIALPPLPEQHQIVRFLDDKTAKIDRLIRLKQRKIDLLREKRTALINHVVTKGLYPNVKMKDSGVEWIGEVPEHWKITKLKYEYSIQSGGTPSKDNAEYWDGHIPWVSPKDMKSIFITESVDKITEEGLNAITCKLIPENSLLLVVRSGILQRTIPVAINAVPVTINQDLKAVCSKGAATVWYLYYFIKGNELNLLNDWGKQGATVESIETEFMMGFEFPLPPKAEQEVMTHYLNQQTSEIDTLIQMEQKKIDLLKEYRQALISEVVTGKVRVCEADVPENALTHEARV